METWWHGGMDGARLGKKPSGSQAHTPASPECLPSQRRSRSSCGVRSFLPYSFGGGLVTERRAVEIDGVTLHLMRPEETVPPWIGQREVLLQLLAAWSRFSPRDQPLNPRLLGKPGVGKTTLACAAARELDLPIYIVQATMDTRPEDLIVTPVLDPDGGVRYMASPLVTAMIRGGVCILDEGNRMSEKSWASLAPLLDHRRSVDSIVAGITIHAHDDFRFVTTMNATTGGVIRTVLLAMRSLSSPA